MRFDVAEGQESEQWTKERDSVSSIDRTTVEGATRPGRQPVDLQTLGRFKDVRNLKLCRTYLNGRYPFLFNFQTLETLDLHRNEKLKWDLSDLKGLPNLSKLNASCNRALTGNTKSLRILKQKLVVLQLPGCEAIEGSIHDLEDFPNLQELILCRTKIEGDIRKIGADDFVALKYLDMDGAVCSQLASVSEAGSCMLARYHLKKRRPELNYGPLRQWPWRLAETSLDYYEFSCNEYLEPPFLAEFVIAGPRMGWRWTNSVNGHGACDTIWFDPEPVEGDAEYDYYKALLILLANFRDNDRFFRGYKAPPNERQHQNLLAA